MPRCGRSTQAAAALGADVRHRTRATRIEVVDDGLVRVASVTDAGTTEVFEARTAVVTLGAWTTKLLGGVPGVRLPRLTVTQEQPAHFAVRDAAIEWPSFNHFPGAADAGYGYWLSPVYGMLTPGEGVKAGWHGVGPVVDPDARDFAAGARAARGAAALRRRVAPGRRPRRGDPDQLHLHDDARRGLRARPRAARSSWAPVLGARLQVHARRSAASSPTSPTARAPRPRCSPPAADRGSAGVADRPRRLSLHD